MTFCTRCTAPLGSIYYRDARKRPLCQTCKTAGPKAPRRTAARDAALREALAFIPPGPAFDGLREIARKHIGRGDVTKAA
jgi:hypothetical protein